MNIVITGGGWAGCAAAYMATTHGMNVTLLERTDLLLGTGLVGGIMRNNGRFTATEEMIAMGGGGLFEIIDQNLRHRNINFPGHQHASLYDITKVPAAIYRKLAELGVTIHLESRVSQITIRENNSSSSVLSPIHIMSVSTEHRHDSQSKEISGDVFIDTTGTCGPIKNCTAYGNGCAMCILRCPSFGSRQSLTSLAHLPEISGQRINKKPGSISGSCKILKESLSPELIHELNEKGVVIIPIPKELQRDHLADKCCQQYAYNSYLENLVLLDTGHAKLMTPFYPLELLQQVPGFEHARYEDPYSAGIGNSIRFTSCCHCEDTMRVMNSDNLFCAGEKAGLFVGHTEAIVTGVLAGYNAAMQCLGKPLLTLPRSLCTGELIAYGHEQMQSKEGLVKKYTFSGSVFFERMKQLGLYTTDIANIKKRVEKNGFLNVFTPSHPM